jgi:hypothetical protein
VNFLIHLLRTDGWTKCINQVYKCIWNKSSHVNHLNVTANQPAELQDPSKLQDWLVELLEQLVVLVQVEAVLLEY